MERTKRRWWTWAVSLIAATVIVGAVSSGAFQLAVLAVPSYREDLAAWVGDATGRPVQIGGISLSWRGLAPRFDLSGITLYSDDGQSQISVDRLSLGFSLERALRGEWMPSRLELSGLRLSAYLDEDGKLRVAGFEVGAEESPRRGQWQEGLERFDRVRLENCELRVRHPLLGELPTHLRLAEAQIDRSGSGLSVEADIRVPADRGGSIELQAQIDGPAAQPQDWAGRFEVQFDDLQPQGWLRHWLLPGAQILAADLDGRLEGEIVRGMPVRARLELGSGGLVLSRAGVLSSARSSSAVLAAVREPRGWRVDVADLSFDEAPLLRGSLRIEGADDATAYDFDADRLELTRLAAWAGVWRATPSWLQMVSGASGEVEGLVLRYRHGAGAPRYALRARLHDIALRTHRAFGFSGLDGELGADENGGTLRLTPGPLTVTLPETLERDVPIGQLRAELGWSRTTQGWRVASEDFSAQLASISADGRVEILLPQDAAPQIDLAATLQAGTVLDAAPYMPQHWPDSLKSWLERAIVAARIPNGDLRIRGPLRDFPYHRRPTGEWSLELEVADAALDYAPRWPRLEDLRARLIFGGNGLRADVLAGRALDSRISEARVWIDDFKEQRLGVDALVDGTLPGHYAFLEASPLRERLAVLLDRTRAQGDARVTLRLDVPLRETAATQVEGTVALDGATLHYQGLEPPIEALGGVVGFNNEGVTAEALRANFADVPLALRIDAQDGSFGIVRADFAFAPQADGGGLSRFLPAFMRAALHGRSAWQATLPLQADTRLTLASALQGTTVDLPPPLAKDADTAAPVQLRIGADDEAGLRVGLDYAERAGLDLRLRRNADDAATTLGGLYLRLGAGTAPRAQPGRIEIDGQVETLDLTGWQRALNGPAPSVAPAGADDSGAGPAVAAVPRIDAIDIDAGRVIWGQTAVAATRLQYAPQGDGWRVDLDGAGARGELRWLPAGEGHLVARLQHLNFESLQPQQAPDAGAGAVADPIDPSRLPTLDLLTDALGLGETQMGRGELSTQRIPGGQTARIRFAGGDAELSGDGRWQRQGGRSSGELAFELQTRYADRLLVALGYAPNVEADSAALSATLSWAPHAEGLRWELAEGRIDLDFRDGQLRAVKPGASRALALLNFYTLPRRLALNFDDVVGEGLAFDRIGGRFTLAGGQATTQDLRVDGSSLSMDVRGSVGLLARDYDQRITVYPDVSSGVTLGAVLLGGPAVGALVLLAQELLDKPLEQVTQFSYRVSGSWDNPRVERIESSDGAAGQGAG